MDKSGDDNQDGSQEPSQESTSDILIYQNQGGDIQLDVNLDGETVWLNQAQMAQLFGKARNTITEHLGHIFAEGELEEKQVCRDFRHTTPHGAIKGKTQQQTVKYYNLDVIISVGYRVKSQQGTQFRIWATQRLKEYIVKGFILNDDRFKTGNSMNYFDELQQRIRDIRISEKFFYQKIKDIYTTSIDYDVKSQATTEFFKKVQNKLLWAISSQTAAELVYRRVDASLPLLGMTSYDKTSNIEKRGIRKSDTSIAKNYLNEDEIKLLGLLVEQYLAFAETMAQQQTAMTMKDWIERLDVILKLNGRELLSHAGKISHQQALDKSNEAYQQYKQEQKQIEQEMSLKEIEADIKKLGKK
ncbi:MAG: RhuM family protein [Methylococcales bacterium]